MFKIYDGRDQFYQWDLDRKLIIADNTINQVHFCNRTSECSLVCNVYEEDGLCLVNVPNVLLQTDWRINVYGYDKNYTKHNMTFDVIKRSRPDDYEYVDVEHMIVWEDLEQRVSAIEEGTAGGTNEVYIGTEEPTEPNVDLWVNPEEQLEFVTKEYVDKAIANIPAPKSGGKWVWVDSDTASYDRTYYSSSHVKAVGYIGPRPDIILSFDISTSHGNQFSEEYDTTYSFVFSWNNKIGSISFYNIGEALIVSEMNCEDPDYTTLNLLGFYYWEE